MSEILKVLNRKSVELKSEVVELGLFQDMEKKGKELKSGQTAAIASIKKAEQVVGDYQVKWVELIQLINKLENQAKDLGATDLIKNIAKKKADASESYRRWKAKHKEIIKLL
tara:strand:+ start:63 stop:398 length:336 start_codon:yes stop_codon:yes gene_type:complete